MGAGGGAGGREVGTAPARRAARTVARNFSTVRKRPRPIRAPPGAARPAKEARARCGDREERRGVATDYASIRAKLRA